jgi:nitronate monooxygenase
MLRTRLCETLGIRYPIIGAPMGFVTGAELAAAVSNAGGLGIMSFSANPPAVLRQEIRRLRALTDKPFGVNLILHFPVEEHVTACLEERVPVLSFFWGDPTPYVGPAHDAGVKVFDQVGSVAGAQRSARAGVDVIIAQGGEAGGHLAGDVALSVLVPRVVDTVSPVPVVAAGGIADARGVVAALALGADGVSIGTRFLATPEAAAHPTYKAKVLAAGEGDTVRTTLFGYGWPDAPHRTLRTPFVEHWLAHEARGGESRPDEPIIGQTRIGGMPVPIPRFSSCPPNTDATGDLESMALLAGQTVGLVDAIKPAAEIVRELVEGAARIIAGPLATCLVSPSIALRD